eukprot:COSAG01_NODE_431_length_17124_cov_26.577386_15_plen_117_part_00
MRSEELAVHDRIVSIDTLGSSAAAAKVQVALPASGGGSTLFTDFLVLLRMEEVSAAVSSDEVAPRSTDRKCPAPPRPLRTGVAGHLKGLLVGTVIRRRGRAVSAGVAQSGAAAPAP